MISRWQLNLLTALAGIALATVVADGVLFVLNQGAQQSLNQRQAFVQQTVPLQGLYNEIAKALAETAVKSNDRQVLDMLASQGLNVSVNSPAGDAGARKGDK
jgi:hypothetical protein